ncbi:MAG: hypothetical protein IRZ05_01660 [Micromonosporaceae bacterium]|nr:hypothetical protein [Micromonosporaceae bacterium]
MQPLSLWFGHGDDDPHGIELNDGLGLHVLSLDMGQPDEATDRRDITVTVLARGATVAAASRRVQQLSRLVTRAAQRHAGTVAPATLRISGASLETTWWDVLQVTTAMGAEGVDSALRSGHATVEITFTTRAYGRGAPVTLVEGAIVDQANPVLVLPPVDTDAPAELEVDLDDLTTGGTGVNRWRVAAMPLSPDADVPTLALDLTDPATPAPDAGTLSGNAPVGATVRQDWVTLAEGEITWPEDAPPPQAALLLARVADSEPVGAPIERLSVRQVDGPLAFKRVEVDGNTVTFPAVPANSMLVAVAQAKTTGAFTWPAGWTVQATAAANGWRVELATCPVATETETASVTVTAGGAQLRLVGYAVPGATGVAGAVSLNAAGSVTLPGSAAYHATIAMGFAQFAAPPSPLALENEMTGQLRLNVVSKSHGLVPSTSEPIAEMAYRGDVAHYAGIGTGAPGSLRYRPVTIANFISTTKTSRDPWTGEEVPVRVTTTTPARMALLVAVVLTTTQTAPAVTAGTYRVGVTGLMADGRETPLLLTETVRTRGLRPIAAAWQPALAAAAGMAYWRVYYQLQGQAWRYIQVDADVYAATITSTAAGTLGSPPQAVALTGAEIRAVVSAAPGAARARELPPAACQVGMGRWEVVPVGVVPLPLVPGGPARLHVEIRARTAIGARLVWLDRVQLVPVHQELGSLVAELRDRARPVPMRWRHRVDPTGRASMRLWGTVGDAQAPAGIQLDSLGTEDVDDPDWTVPRVRVGQPGQQIINLEPSQSFGLDGPHWMGALAANDGGSPVQRPGLPYEDAGAEAYPGGGDTMVLRAKATGTISPAIPVTPSTQYTGSAYVRVPVGGASATVKLRLVWYDIDGSTSLGQVDGAALVTTDTWQLLSVTGEAPAEAVAARLHLIWENGTADVWLDAVQVEAGPGRTVYHRRETPSPNLLVNPSFAAGTFGWQLYGGAFWESGQINVNGPSQRGIISDPVRVRPGVTYTASCMSSFIQALRFRFYWYDTAGTLLLADAGEGTQEGSGRRFLTRTAPANAASVQVEIYNVGGSSSPPRTVDDVRLVEGSAANWAAADHTATPPVLGGALTLLPSTALADVTAARGWLLMRFSNLCMAPATVWQWRAGDNDYLALELTATQVILARTTGGVRETVVASRPSDRLTELVAYATWSEGHLALRVHDGTVWGAEQTAASTSWPDLSNADWRLGSRLHDDGSEDQYLWGRLVWAALGTEPDGFDPTAIPALVGEEPIPDDFPDAAGLAWLWTSTNPGRMVVWREGGYATASGTVRAYDGPTALVVIGETAGWEHRPSRARLTVRARPATMYLRGA